MTSRQDPTSNDADVIDLTDEDPTAAETTNDENAVNAASTSRAMRPGKRESGDRPVAKILKRLASLTPLEESGRAPLSLKKMAAPRKKVKTEGASSRANASLPAEDEEIQVVETPAAQQDEEEIQVIEKPANAVLFQKAPPSGSTTATAASQEEDEEIQVVGTVGQTLLPHMRQHCTNKVFISTHGPLATEMHTHNKEFCDFCFCYVCDIQASQCQDWMQHCHAEDRDLAASHWKEMRAKAKRGELTTSAAKTYSPAVRQQLAASARQSTELDNVFQPRPRLEGKGPFAPDNEVAKSVNFLTACRHCGWYNRFAHKNYAFFREHQPAWRKPSSTYNGNPESGRKLDIHPIGYLDWCHACGRVASERDLSKEQGETFPGDVFLGTYTIPFSIHAHDPTRISPYQDKWQEHHGEAGWVYSENDMQEEVFQHRLGQLPTLANLLKCIPLQDARHIANQRIGKKSSANELDAVFVANNHLAMLQSLFLASPQFGETTQSPVSVFNGGITSTWNKEARCGTLKLTVYVNTPACRPTTPTAVSSFLGSWYGILPLSLSQASGLLQSHAASELQDKANHNGSTHKRFALPPFELKDDKLRTVEDEVIDKQNAAAEEWTLVRPSHEQLGVSLLPGASCADVGGISPSENDFASIMTHLVREILPDIVRATVYMQASTRKMWLEYVASGRVSYHREFRHKDDYKCCLRSNRRDWTTGSFLGHGDLVLASSHLLETTKSIFNHTASLTGILDHLQNRGHQAAPHVEGLTVELLPFQSQSLQWALDREKMPGGVQTLWVSKLPSVEQPDTDLYLNTVVGSLSKKKPGLVRGGLIASAMGLGKTVLSLSLILCNPAPAFPASGDAVATIPSAPSGTNFWDPDLFSKKSASQAKRGSIISHGTLVVCKVSLVGQWVDEAMSKLSNPGLVYAYHGANRKRDPLALAKNSIIVTTYETIASDATYHAKKNGGDATYCPVLEQIRFWRIICDESHTLKNGSTMLTSIKKISADHVWLVSGTPVNTSLADLTTQLDFLGIENASSMMEVFRKSTFKHTKDKRATHRDCTFDGPHIGLFTFFMRSIMIRHSHSMQYSGTNTTLMSLPPKTERVVTIPFLAGDRKEYDKLEATAQKIYVEFKKLKINVFRSKFLAMQQKLLPMRVACAGGQVPLEAPEVNSKDDSELQDNPDDEEATKKPKAYSKYAFTSKLIKLVEELKSARKNDETSKSLVFSQFASTIKWLQLELPKHGFQFRTLSGDMSLSKRAKALRDFQNDPPTTVFLLSMRAGAVGINLTQANRVFILEPCLNPALVAQAVGRVHRLGQKRPVEIIHFLIEKSVETRMHKLLEKKYGSSVTTESSSSGKSKSVALGSLISDKATMNMMENEFDLLYGYGIGSEEATAGTNPIDESGYAIHTSEESLEPKPAPLASGSQYASI